MAKSLVFGQDNPAPSAHFRKPVDILRIGSEVVSLDFNIHTLGAKCSRNYLGAKALVYEECWLTLLPGS